VAGVGSGSQGQIWGRGAEAQREDTVTLQMWGEFTLVDLRIFQIEMPWIVWCEVLVEQKKQLQRCWMVNCKFREQPQERGEWQAVAVAASLG
jgi:CheY-like chemotaxis protein